MMRKLPKQHLLGLALALVGVGSFLGIQLSTVTNQHTYASWLSNDDLIDHVFRGGTPSNASIINALFGDGNGGSDPSFYTQHWTSNTCNTGAMSVVNLSPGTDTIPSTLNANTIYVLDVGSYTTTYASDIVFNGNCIALIGKSVGTNFGDMVYIGMDAGFDIIGSKQNDIIANVNMFRNTPPGDSFAVYASGASNSTFWPISAFSFPEPIYLEYTDHMFVGGMIGPSQSGIKVYNSSNIYVGTPSILATSTNSDGVGFLMRDTDNIYIYANTTNNTILGGYFENTNNLNIQGGTWMNNGTGFAASGALAVSGSQNVNISGGWYTGNTGPGISTYNVSNFTINGTQIANNTFHGIFVQNSTSGYISNTTSSLSTTAAGIEIESSDNIDIVGSTVNNNAYNGIMVYDSNNTSISGSTVTGTTIGAGITLYGYGLNSYNNTIAYTTSAQNASGAGIAVVGGYNNIITHSITYANHGVGMGIAIDAYNNTISYSTSYNNIGFAGFGLSLNTTGNTLHDLYAYGNGSDGVAVYTATTGANYIHDIYAYLNTDNGLNIIESENISGYNIHTYSNEKNGIAFSNTADHNNLSFIDTYSNSDNGISISDSESNVLQNIITYDNANEGIVFKLKSSSNTIYNTQAYNNRVGIRALSSATTAKIVIANASVYNNRGGGVALNSSMALNNASVYNNSTGLSTIGSNNVVNNVDVFNNNYGVYVTASVGASNAKFNNLSVYNNTRGITIAPGANSNTYQGLHMFDNTTPFVGTNGNDAQLTSTAYSWTIGTGNNLNDTGSMTCNRAIQSTNNAGQNLLVYPYCNTRGVIGGWTPSKSVQYTFFPYIYKQQQPVYVTGSQITNTGIYVASMFVGDFVYSGTTAFGGYMDLTNEGATFASGGFTYRYDNGPFDIEMNSNVGTTKGFVVTGVSDVMWDGVVGQVGSSWNGLQYPLISQYLVAGNGLKIFRAGYNITSQGLVSNYYGQLRGVQAPVCGNTIVEPTEQCDDGNAVAGDGCSDQCQIEAWDCAWFSGRVSNGVAPHNVTVSIISGISMNSYTINPIVWGDNTANGDITTGNTHTYFTGGTYTGSIQVTTQFTPFAASSRTCNFPVTVTVPSYCGDGTFDSGEQCDDGNNNNNDGCSSTCTLESGASICSIPILPSFVIDEYTIRPYLPSSGASILHTATIVSTTTSTAPIVSYVWDVVSSGTMLNPSPFLFDSGLILSGQGTPNITLDFSAYSGDGDWPAFWLSLTVIDASGYQAQTYQYFARSQDQGGFYSVFGDQITNYAFSGMNLSIVGAPIRSIANSGNTSIQTGITVNPADGVFVPGITQIGREISGAIDTGFYNYGNSYFKNHTYSSGLSTLTLYSTIGTLTGQNFNISHTTYPVSCVTCGDGTVNQQSEQCDDNNLTNGDGCNSQCLIEVTPPTCGDGAVNQQSEQCDDNNLTNGDGCNSSCQLEPGCSIASSLLLDPNITTGSVIYSGAMFGGSGGYEVQLFSSIEGTEAASGYLRELYNQGNPNGPYIIAGSITDPMITIGVPIPGGNLQGSIVTLTVQGVNGSIATQPIIIGVGVGGGVWTYIPDNQYSNFLGLTFDVTDDSIIFPAGAGSGIIHGLSLSGSTYMAGILNGYNFGNTGYSTYTGNTLSYTLPSYGQYTLGYAVGYTSPASPFFDLSLAAQDSAVVSATIQCIVATCGDGTVNQPSEQCDDGNADDFDGCDSQCTVNQCSTTVSDLIDPSIAYQRAYPIYTGSTGVVLLLNTPTIGSGYQYQWSLSGLNTTGINSFQFSGSSTSTGVQVFVSSNTSLPNFSIYVGLTITDGLVTGYANALVTCNSGNSSCSAVMYNYRVTTGDIQGFNINGDYNYYTYQQTVNASTPTTPAILTGVTTNGSRGSAFFGIYGTGLFFNTYTSSYNAQSYSLDSGANRDIVYTSRTGLGPVLSNNLGLAYANNCVALCGNGILESSNGTTTSGTIDYISYASIYAQTGYNVYNQSGYQTGGLFIFTGGLNTGTAVTYQWILTGSATSGSATAFIVGSSTGSTVSIFSNAFGTTGWQWQGVLTLNITDLSGHYISTRGYYYAYRDGMTVVYPSVGTMSISGSQVTYSNYLVHFVGTAGLWPPTNFFTNTGVTWTTLFQNSGQVGLVWYGDDGSGGYYQGTGQATHSYNVTGADIQTHLYMNFSGNNTTTGTIYQYLVLHNTAGTSTGGYAEQCDDNNLTNGDGCDNSCNLEPRSCNRFTTTATSGATPHSFSISLLPGIYTGGYSFGPIFWMTGATSGNIITDNTFVYTGVGTYHPRIRATVQAGQQQQYAQLPSPSCSRTVTVTSTCGNNIVEGTEQCDDNNLINGDGCSSQCTIEVSQTCNGSGNLVANPGFESYTQCPTHYGQFNGVVAGWYSPGGDPDYGRLGCPYGNPGIFADLGQTPHLGSSGAVNILTYASNMSNGGREYVGAQLTTPMQVGNYYNVGFCYASHHESNFLTDKIGMLFSSGSYPTQIGWQPILQTPQFEHTGYPTGSGRTCVTGTVYAAEAYDHFLIGSFHDNSGQNMVPNPIYSGNISLGYTVSNYFIDDVFVSPICTTCGDGQVDIGEQCDLGTGNGNINSCSMTCQINPFYCSQVTSSATGYAPLSFSPGGQMSLINRRYSYLVNRGDGFTSNPRGGTPHTYTGVGNYTGSISLNYSGLTTTGILTNFNITCPFNVTTVGTTCGNGQIDSYMTGATNGVITSMTYADINARSFQSHYAPYTNPNATGGLQTGYAVYDTNSGAMLPNILASTWPNPISVTNDIVLEAVLTGSQTAASYAWTVNLSQPGFTYSVVTGYVVGSTTGQTIVVHTNTLYLGTNATQLSGTISVVITTTSGNQVNTTASFTARGNGTRGIYYPSVDVSISGSQVTYNNSMSNFAGYGILGGQTFYSNTTTSGDGVQINPYTNGINCNTVPNGLGCIPALATTPTIINYTASGLLITTTLFDHGISTLGQTRSSDIHINNSSRTILFETAAGSPGTSVTEQCDDGNQNNTDGCSNSCQWVQASCTLQLYPSSGIHPLPVIFSLAMPQGVALSVMNYGDGTTGTIYTGHTYASTGLFTPIAFVHNISNTGITSYCQGVVTSASCTSNNQCPSGLVCLPDGTCGGACTNGATNPPLCNVCGTGQVLSGNQCTPTCTNGATNPPACNICPAGKQLKNGQCETTGGGGGGGGIHKDDCHGNPDNSPSYYDGKCDGEPSHFSAPVGRACRYSDEKYLARGPFTDTYKHRALPYTEMMRASCMWRGRDTDEGQWHANPDENITVAEALKTFVKVEGVAFEDFDIKTEDALYPKATPFADIPQNHWFAWYSAYAVKRGLTQGLVTSKDGKQYLDPDKPITRNDAIKLMMLAYDAINKKKVSIDGKSVLGDVVNASDPYYQYIRKAEALGFISGVKQKDGTYRFDGKRAITRAEFAKIVSVPFNDQLFDTSSLVLNSPVYAFIVKSLDKVQGDKIQFLQTLLLNMAKIPDTQFIRKFKVTKVIFIQEIRNAILPGLYEEASN